MRLAMFYQLFFYHFNNQSITSLKKTCIWNKNCSGYFQKKGQLSMFLVTALDIEASSLPL